MELTNINCDIINYYTVYLSWSIVLHGGKIYLLISRKKICWKLWYVGNYIYSDMMIRIFKNKDQPLKKC